MDRFSEITRILEEEYGITTAEELDTAISKLGKIDISIMCVTIQEPDRRKSRDPGRTKTKKRAHEEGKNQENQGKAR